MLIALKEAKKAFDLGEIPIGAVIVCGDKLLSKAHNKRNKKKDAICHAETLCISKTCKKLKDWRLNNCEMYVTCVPCPMCAGAIVNARIKHVYYGATNDNQKLFEEIMQSSALNHKTKFTGGILKKECSNVLSEFFAKIR